MTIPEEANPRGQKAGTSLPEAGGREMGSAWLWVLGLFLG